MPTIYDPIKINSVTIPNRLAMTPMVSLYGDTSGMVTQRLIDYYAERAKNKVGLIIVEAIGVVPNARISTKQLYICDDSFIPGLKKLTEAIHASGARCFVQLHHGGRRAPAKDNGGTQPVSASPIAMLNGDLPRQLTSAEIDDIVTAFAQGARRAKAAGFDGVELHFAHGYLVAQFLSPLINKRTDKYGGDLASRARFALEITRRVRQEVGPDYPVSARITGDETIKGGMRLREVQRLAGMLEEAGLDALHVTVSYVPSHEEGYFNVELNRPCAPMALPRGNYLPFAEAIKKVVKIPVLAVGRLDDPELAEKVISEGRADLVAVGRGLITDPAFARKTLSKEYDEMRRCIACNHCLNHLMGDLQLTCTVNAEVGKEAEYRIIPAEKPKRVVIVGGGPGGMEMTRVAALRGHSVVLLEKKPYLGGNMVAAASPSFKRDIALFTRYLSHAMRKLCQEVYLETEGTTERIMALKPDVVVLATGASPLIPDIHGIHSGNVTDAISVLEGRILTGKRVIVAGGGAVGCETATFLAEAGKEVTVVEMRDTDYSAGGGLAPDMDPDLRRWLLFDRWPRLPIDVVGKSTFEEVTDKGLVVKDREGKLSLVPGDTIVFAAGMTPNNGLKKTLQGKVPELYEVGDCIRPCHIIDAVQAAAKLARTI